MDDDEQRELDRIAARWEHDDRIRRDARINGCLTFTTVILILTALWLIIRWLT